MGQCCWFLGLPQHVLHSGSLVSIALQLLQRSAGSAERLVALDINTIPVPLLFLGNIHETCFSPHFIIIPGGADFSSLYEQAL